MGKVFCEWTFEREWTFRWMTEKDRVNSWFCRVNFIGWEREWILSLSFNFVGLLWGGGGGEREGERKRGGERERESLSVRVAEEREREGIVIEGRVVIFLGFWF